VRRRKSDGPHPPFNMLELDGRDLRRSLERSVSIPGDQYLRSTFAAKQANSTNSRRW